MAYGLRYTITQALRDGTTLNANIYEKDYSGSVLTYEAINISLESNASNDEPLAGIISSQLNISFLTTEENGETFPEILSFDIRKYFVKLYTVNIETPLWVGFLFNDYVQIPFTTGNVQVDIVAIDGLSFLDYTEFIYQEADSINSVYRLIDIIAETLNVIAYPDPIMLLTSCSYYAEGMYDRSDASAEEPFEQTYQYRRDFQDKTYYEVLENIIQSFGCRLFQSDGKWQILAINQMALDTRYFTNYVIYPTVSNSGSGTFDKNITIEPYSDGNVHFINNNQNKIVRKGYPKLTLTYNFDYPNSYIHNGTFKGIQGDPYTSPNSNNVYGWYLYQSTGTYFSNTVEVVADSNFNNINLTAGATAGATAYFQNIPIPPVAITYYAPYMVGPQFTVSLEHIMLPNTVGRIEIRLVRGVTSYYYNSANTWQTTQTYLTIDNPYTADTYRNEYNSYSIGVNMTTPAIPVGVGLQWGGYVLIKIFVQNGTDHSNILFRNLKISQTAFISNSIEVTREVGTENNNIKELDQPYGSYAEFRYTLDLLTNNLGVLYNSAGSVLKNWYRYPRTESFPLLQMLIARQYSNLLNKNFATLEADLGSFQTAKGLNYLDKVYSLTDSATNALSYDGLKFLMNRGGLIPYTDEVQSFQIIEVTDTDNASTETVKYIDS